MNRPTISTILRRLTTDSDALRDRIAELNEERDAALLLAGDFKFQANDLCRELDDVTADRDRLRAIVGNTEPTPGERLMLDIVRGAPGLLALEYGEAHAKALAAADLAETPGSGWARRVVEDGPDHWFIRRSASPLTGLHKKGFVRREKSGQTYRYWAVTP